MRRRQHSGQFFKKILVKLSACIARGCLIKHYQMFTLDSPWGETAATPSPPIDSVSARHSGDSFTASALYMNNRI